MTDHQSAPLTVRGVTSGDTRRARQSVTETVDQLVDRAEKLASEGERRILGITGAPGAGKSTLTAALLLRLGSRAALVPMDGFHLANDELRRLGRRDRKGAPDTFDVDGYRALLGRLRDQDAPNLYAPRFDRRLEESIGSAIAVDCHTPLIITEGNYLLHDSNGWEGIRSLLDECWYLDVPSQTRVARLVNRRRSHGDSTDDATEWVRAVDEQNARLVIETSSRADIVVHVSSPLQTP